MRALALAVLLQAALLGARGSLLKRIEAPCTACRAVASELQRRIDAEPVRNHLDLRHRLDKNGQRYGKVIAYKSSELRAVELLDGLCDRMREYTLVSPAGKKTVFWFKVRGAGAGNVSTVTRPPREEEDAKGKRLEAYCGSLVEEYEEDIYAGVMKGGFDTQGVERILCRTIITPCPAAPPAGGGSSEEAGAEASDDDAGDEGGQQEASAEDAAASSGSGSGAGSASSSSSSSGGGETRYIENETIQVGKDGTFEL